MDTLAIATKNCLGRLIQKKCGFWNPQIALVQKPTFFPDELTPHKLEIYRTLEGTGVLPALSAVGFYEA